ncbi:MAG: phage tail assembly protein [Methylotenera sp.]|nr:phage tail assembly protein [Methylotenera sp.]
MKKLTLKHPLKLGEKTTITELNFRDYTTAADYLSFDIRGGVAQRIALIASLTGTDETLIQQLRGADYRRAEAIADALMSADEVESADGGDSLLTPEQEASLKK